MGLNAPALVLGKNFTKDTADEFGAVKGANAQVSGYDYDADGNTIAHFLWVNTAGTSQKTDVTIKRGRSIKSFDFNDKKELVVTLDDDTMLDPVAFPNVAISKAEGNALTEKEDGLYVSKTGVTISEEEGNIIKQKDDGLYAKADEIKISAKEGNILENITDEGDDNGLYVPETPIVDEFGDDPSDDNVPSEKLVKDSLDDIDKKIDDIQLFKFPNAVIVGAPTINNGQISGFSTANYMKFPFLMDFKGRPFKIKMEFTTGSNVTAQENIFDSNFGLAFAIRDAKFVIAVSSNGTSWDVGEGVGNVIVQPNTSYMVELAWDGISYTLDYSTDGGESYLNDILKASDKSPYPKQVYIGVGQLNGVIMNAFSGIVNFNFAELYVSNALVWQGMDDVGLATRLATDLGNIDAAGIAKIEEIAGIDDYVKKTAIVKAFNASTSDEKVPSEKLVKDSLDTKLNSSQGTDKAGKMLVVGTDGKVTTSSTVKGTFYVEDSTPEGDRSGLSIIPNGSRTTIHPTGDSSAIEIDDDLVLGGNIKKGDVTAIELGNKGHLYIKTGVDIGEKGVSPKPLNVHGTLNVDGHSIYCEGIKATDSVWVEDYVKTDNLMAASAVFLGNANSDSDIHFLCKNVRVVGEHGKEAMTMDSPLALMSSQSIYIDGKMTQQAHLDMGYSGGPGHISTGRLDVKRLQSNSNGGIDVGTPMRFESHIDCGEINIEGGYALNVKDEAGHQNMKLTGDGSIFCGDIHCNYPPSSPYGEGTKHSGNAYGEHSIDGVGYFTARNITTYESITYRRGSGKRDWYLGLTAEVGTLTSSSLTIKQSLVYHRMLNFMLIKSGNVLCDSQTFVLEQFPAPSGGAVVLRTETNTVINVGISINNSTINVSSLPSGYTVKVVGLS